MKSKVNLLPDEIKFQVVQEYLNGYLSQKDLMLKYNIRGKQCINNWMRKFGVPKLNGKSPMDKHKTQIDKDYSQELKIKKLEEELKHEQLRTKALNMMIDIAERELKIDIRKKSGTKR